MDSPRPSPGGGADPPFIGVLPATNSVASLAEVDSYTFSGNVGETVVIGASSTNFIAAAFVSSPTGQILANWASGVTTLTLPNTGNYSVGIYSFYIGGTGPYTASLSFTKLVPASYRLALGRTNGAAALTLWGQVGHATPLQYSADLGPPQWGALITFHLPPH